MATRFSNPGTQINHGGSCPVCGSADVDVNDFEHGGQNMTVYMVCNGCDASYTGNFTYTGLHAVTYDPRQESH